MENQRLYLFIALSFVLFMIYNAWHEQHAPKPAQVAEVPAAVQGVPAVAPTASPNDIPGVQPATPMATQSSPVQSITQGKRIRVLTDLFDIEIDTTGADIRRVDLLTYQASPQQPNTPVRLFNDVMPELFIAQSGLLSAAGQNVDHHVIFNADKPEYRLADGQDTLDVALTWQSPDGLKVSKIYTFHRGRFVVDMKVQVSNGTPQEWSGRLYRQLQRSNAVKQDSRFINTYTGGVVSNTDSKYQKVKFDDMVNWHAEQNYNKGGWVAVIQHYFFAAWIPPQDEYNHFYTSMIRSPVAPEDNRYLIGLQTAEQKIAVGQTGAFNSQLFIGPKQQDLLPGIAPNLELTVDYGVLTLLAQPLYWALDKIHKAVNNWGWAIIILTLSIKLIFYKLSEAAYRSMARMRKFQPKLQALKERYGDDKQRMSQAMMELYKKEKINPLGGCLPMLVQIPVFIALYWVLLGSVELRHAHFILWLTDLSAKDPYYVLPVLNGVFMFLQQKLNPAPMDPMQQKIFQFLPLVFTLFFAFFPAGLVLYWLVNNMLSIAQQWAITRTIAKEPVK